jgi:hypothetical protein
MVKTLSADALAPEPHHVLAPSCTRQGLGFRSASHKAQLVSAATSRPALGNSATLRWLISRTMGRRSRSRSRSRSRDRDAR